MRNFLQFFLSFFHNSIAVKSYHLDVMGRAIQLTYVHSGLPSQKFEDRALTRICR